LLYILWGQDDYSLYGALQEIKNGLGDRAMLDINTTKLDGQQLTLEQLKTACETVPFMAPSRLVIVIGLLGRFESRGRGDPQKKEARANRGIEYDNLVNCIKSLPPSTVLVLVDEVTLKTNNTLLKELSDKAVVRTFPPLRGNNLRQWIQKYLTNKGGAITTEAMALLSELIGSNLWAMASELDKLILYNGGKVINGEDVKAVVSSAQEFDAYDMVDAILEFRGGAAEKSLQQLLLRGVSPSYLLVILARQIQRLVLARDMKTKDMADAEIQRKLNITLPFVWQKVREHAGKHSLERLRAIYDKLLETDLAIKTGRYDGELALNMLIAELCHTGR